MESIGERIRWARHRSGMTLADVSKATGMTAAALSRIELGQAQPRPTTMRRLATALGVRVEWLSVGEMPPVAKDADDPPPELWRLPVAEQHRAHNGPGTEGKPGYVIVEPDAGKDSAK